MRGEGPSSTDVCEIIKASAASGVSKLEWGKLKIEFGGASAEMHPSSTPVEITEEAANIEEQAAIAQAEVSIKQEDLATLLARDPEQYERLMMEGELKPEQEVLNG